MSEEIFLRNSAYIQQLLSQQPSDQSAFPLEHVFGLVKYSVGSWIKTAAVMSAGYFDRELVTEEPEEPIIEPLEAERDDEILANQEVVTPEEGEDEYQLIVRVLKESNGVVAGPKGAAQRLGLKRTTLLSRMKRLGINKDELV